jgi:hypothetical protein
MHLMYNINALMTNLNSTDRLTQYIIEVKWLIMLVKQSQFCSENQVKAIVNSVNEMFCYLTLKQVVHIVATILYCKRYERKVHMLF